MWALANYSSQQKNQKSAVVQKRFRFERLTAFVLDKVISSTRITLEPTRVRFFKHLLRMTIGVVSFEKLSVFCQIRGYQKLESHSSGRGLTCFLFKKESN